MECGSIDLAGFLRKNRTKITENELRVFWRQMLEAVHVIHEARIIHSDLKPANFLLVEGRLKLIDFGIANALQVSRTAATKFLSPLLKSTQRCFFLGGWGGGLGESAEQCECRRRVIQSTLRLHSRPTADLYSERTCAEEKDQIVVHFCALLLSKLGHTQNFGISSAKF